MTMNQSFPAFPALVLTSVAVAACNFHQMDDDYGGIEITASSPTAQNPFTTADGWSVDADKLVVHVSAMNVSGADEVLTASAADVFVDLTKSAPQTLLSASARKARVWERVDFEIGPAATGSEPTISGDVAEGDVTRMQNDGVSILLEGSATRGDEKKTFSFALTTDTLWSQCEGGLVVPPNSSTPVDIVFRADLLFAANPDEPAVSLFQPFADADADADGTITAEELAAAPTGRSEGLMTFAAVLDANTRRIVGSYRGTAKCTATPVEAAP
jgi:hypothetical protein